MSLSRCKQKLCKVFSAIRELVDIVKKNSRVGDSGSGVGQGRSPCSRTTINPCVIYFCYFVINFLLVIEIWFVRDWLMLFCD